jgi:hypothetical protein
MRLFPMARVVVVVPILFIPLFFEVYASALLMISATSFLDFLI